MQSVTFTDGETCNYVGDQELSGTWSQDDDAVVIALPGYESMTLKRVEGEDAYVQSGWEDLGERYYPTEEEAVEYRDEFLSGSGERVGKLLESTEWRLEADGNVRKADEAISFKGGKVEFEKGEYDESARFNKVPDESKWVARDHSGECAVEVESFTASRSGSSMVPLYTGTLTVGGEFHLAGLRERAVNHLGWHHSIFRREGVSGVRAFAVCCAARGACRPLNRRL